MKIVLTGGSGFIGTHLTSYFRERDDEVVLLSRSKDQTHYWNYETKEINPTVFENADVVINLSGENIFGRWNNEKKEKIRDSRLNASRFLCDTLMNLPKPPPLYIGASAIGYYGNRKDEILTENSPPGTSFLAEVCVEWEKIHTSLEAKKIRVAIPRFGIVLGEDGGALKQMIKPFKMGLGGVVGSGEQIMSWIAIDDLVLAIQHIIQSQDLSGPINFTSPNSVSNREFTQTLAHLLRRPALFTVPKPLLETFIGSAAEEITASTQAIPDALLKSGFNFQYPGLEKALKKYLRLKS